MPRKRHTRDQIAAKLRQADLMAAQGALQSEIAREVGVSVMTYHRWRKAMRSRQDNAPAATPAAGSAHGPKLDESKFDEMIVRVRELQIENSRLRRLVTDLLLEKLELEERTGAANAASGSEIPISR